MEMGQRSEAGECGCEARTSRAELVGLVQLVRCLRAACALPLAAVGRCSRAGGEEKSVLDLPSGRPLFPFVCTFFFFFISECFIFQKLSFYINLSARYIHSHCQNLHIKHL